MTTSHGRSRTGRDQDDAGKAFNIRRREWFARVRAGVGIAKAWAPTAVAHVVAFDILRGPDNVSHMSTAQIADAIGTSRQVVERAIDALEVAGYLRVLRGQGRGKANEYDLTLPANLPPAGASKKRNPPVASKAPTKRNSPVAFSGGVKGNPPVASIEPEKGNPSVASPDPEPGLPDAEKATDGLQEKATGGLPHYIRDTEVLRAQTLQGSVPNCNSVPEPYVGCARETSDNLPKVATGSAEAPQAPPPPDPIEVPLRDFRAAFPNPAGSGIEETRRALVAALDAGFRPREIVDFALRHAADVGAGIERLQKPVDWLTDLVSRDGDD